MENPLIETIYSRRVTRHFAQKPIARKELETIVEAARWAPSGGNRRLQRFIVVTDKRRIQSIRIMSPGMDSLPSAIIVICTNWRDAESQGYVRSYCGLLIDVGMASENILLTAHSLGIGAGPVVSFSKEAVKVITNLPEWLSPDLLVCLGYPSQEGRGETVRHHRSISWQDLTFWDKYGSDEATSR